MKIELKIPTMEDKDGLKAVCNAVDRKYLSDRLPYPYTDESAEWWINMVAKNDGKTGVWRVICVDGAFCAAGRTPVRLPADTRRRQRTAL